MSDIVDMAEATEAMDRALRINAAQTAAARLDGPPADARDCDDCADPIEPERLKAAPGARRCLCCEEARERQMRLRGRR
ncbi:hypothetical protein D3C80_127080 [compost metagenome]